MSKECTNCKQTKALTEYYNKASNCKPCTKEKQSLIRKTEESKIYQKNYKLIYRYNITLDDYNTLVNKQNNNCKICNKTTKLYVDHNHDTGKVRGLLCNHCNTALGMFRENIKIFLKAIWYLIRS